MLWYLQDFSYNILFMFSLLLLPSLPSTLLIYFLVFFLYCLYFSPLFQRLLIKGTVCWNPFIQKEKKNLCLLPRTVELCCREVYYIIHNFHSLSISKTYYLCLFSIVKIYWYSCWSILENCLSSTKLHSLGFSHSCSSSYSPFSNLWEEYISVPTRFGLQQL
jgi:hypothetical protein